MPTVASRARHSVRTHDACPAFVSTPRQQAEQGLAEERRELAATREAATKAEVALRESHEELQRVQGELQATDARLTVANEQVRSRHRHQLQHTCPPLPLRALCHALDTTAAVAARGFAQGLHLQVETASTEEALQRQKELRTEEQVTWRSPGCVGMGWVQDVPGGGRAQPTTKGGGSRG